MDIVINMPEEVFDILCQYLNKGDVSSMKIKLFVRTFFINSNVFFEIWIFMWVVYGDFQKVLPLKNRRDLKVNPKNCV